MTENCAHGNSEPDRTVRELDIDAPNSPVRLMHDLREVNLGSYINPENGETGSFVRIFGMITDRQHPDGIDQVPQPLELILGPDQAHSLAHALVDVLKFLSQNSEPGA